MKEIVIKCSGALELPLSELNILQDTDSFVLKELSQENFDKLRKSIEKYGFLFPFFVWYCKDEQKWYYTDGTQRHKVLEWMKKQHGEYKLPEKFPVVEIFANSKKEAAKAILLQSSNYGEIKDEYLDEYLSEYDLREDFHILKEELALPDIDVDLFESGFLLDSDLSEIIDVEEVEKTGDNDITCPKCGYEFKAKQ